MEDTLDTGKWEDAGTERDKDTGSGDCGSCLGKNGKDTDGAEVTSDTDTSGCTWVLDGITPRLTESETN